MTRMMTVATITTITIDITTLDDTTTTNVETSTATVKHITTSRLTTIDDTTIIKTIGGISRGFEKLTDCPNGYYHRLIDPTSMSDESPIE